MTPAIGDGDNPPGAQSHDDRFLPARRGDVSVVAQKRGMVPELVRNPLVRFLCELAAFAVGLLILRLSTATPARITISVYGELWPALPLLLFWKAIRRSQKP
jgi:hypothetical protein